MMGWRGVKLLWHHHGTEGSVHQRSRSVWLIINVIYLRTVVQYDLTLAASQSEETLSRQLLMHSSVDPCFPTVTQLNHCCWLTLVILAEDTAQCNSTFAWDQPEQLCGGAAQNLAVFRMRLWEMCCNPRPCWPHRAPSEESARWHSRRRRPSASTPTGLHRFCFVSAFPRWWSLSYGWRSHRVGHAPQLEA